MTRQSEETKPHYLERLLKSGSHNALLLKCADRISNLTDLHRSTHSDQKISEYLDQPEKYVVPMAEKVNADMVIELTDLITKRRRLVELMGHPTD
ncbi:MAG: hypothetical protein P8100_11755 [bacterium]